MKLKVSKKNCRKHGYKLVDSKLELYCVKDKLINCEKIFIKTFDVK